MKYIKLIENDLVLFEKRFYRVEKTKYSNGRMTGKRVIFKLVSVSDFTKIFINGKGGIKE